NEALPDHYFRVHAARRAYDSCRCACAACLARMTHHRVRPRVCGCAPGLRTHGTARIELTAATPRPRTELQRTPSAGEAAGADPTPPPHPALALQGSRPWSECPPAPPHAAR